MTALECIQDVTPTLKEFPNYLPEGWELIGASGWMLDREYDGCFLYLWAKCTVGGKAQLLWDRVRISAYEFLDITGLSAWDDVPGDKRDVLMALVREKIDAGLDSLGGLARELGQEESGKEGKRDD